MKITIQSGDDLTSIYTETIAPQMVNSNTIEENAPGTSSFSDYMAQANTINATSGLSSTQSLQDIFEEAADTYHVDINLLAAIAKQESNFQADATSSSGAMGIMQLMPATASSLGVTDAYDAYDNIMGGAKLISQLLNQYNGDTTLALAAYNAGSGNVAKYGGVPPFNETQNYVKKVTSYYEQGVNIPDKTYIKASATKEEIAKDLATLLNDFSDSSIYTELMALLNEPNYT